MTTGGWMVGAGSGVLLGAACQLQQAALLPRSSYLAAACAGAVAAVLVAVWCVEGWRGEGWRAGVAALITVAIASWGLCGWRAHERLADSLPAELEGVDLAVTGTVSSLPVRTADGVRFRLQVEAARHAAGDVRIPQHVALGWYGAAHDDDATAPAEPQAALRAGQRWRLTLRLRQPHGGINPEGFDYELWLFEQGVRATGYVRTGASAQAEPLDEAARHPVERLRQAVRDRLHERLGDTPAAGVLGALAVGDQASIDRDDWDVFRITGVAHLISISGLHVTMFVWLAGAAIAWLWRRSTWLLLRVPAVQAGRWGGLAAGVGYAVLAGWGVPAQRTVFMVATATVLLATGTRWPWPMVWGAAAVVVTWIDPWALLQPGFWLSFVAVGLLLVSGRERAPVQDVDDASEPSWWQRTLRTMGTTAWTGLRAQVIATLGLAPLSLLFFHQLSVVGFLANLAAIPLVTLVVTPLSLLGIAWPPLWSLAAVLMQALMDGLAVMAAWPWASWSAAAAPWWARAAGLAGACVLVLPLPLRLRALGLLMVGPMLWPPVDRPPAGQFEALAADVGQGTAVLVRTARHALLYDAGPQYARDSDAGERVLVPLLRALGVHRLDVLMLSHRDADHVGGATALLRWPGAAQVVSSLEDEHPLRMEIQAHHRCRAGQAWTWDGVRFEVLHPVDADYQRAKVQAVKPNALSCVLRVSAGERRLLLAGDLERPQELQLVERSAAALRADVLMAPHHGSRTSSTAPFLDAVKPQVVVVQAGYRNRFGHPAPLVLARYDERGIAVRRTDRCGAWRWRSDGDAAGARCERQRQRRYWHAADGAGPVEATRPAD